MTFKRTLACLFIVAAFPLLTSTSNNNSTKSAPFASIVFAGHSLVGGGYWCQCGCAACICDPGETPGACTNSISPTPKKSDSAFNQGASPVGAASTSGFDFGSSALVLALAFLVWARFLRA